jgi:hypothetical protein
MKGVESVGDFATILADRFASGSVIKFIRSDVNFLNACNNVPDTDVTRFLALFSRASPTQLIATAKDKEDARTTITFLYRSNPCCNAEGCKTKYGKETFSGCPKCKRKFCSQDCYLDQQHKLCIQVSNDNFSGCNVCIARPQSLFECDKCFLAFYCSTGCKNKDAASHAKRCCVSDAPPDTGPMALTFVNLKNDVEGAKKRN